MFAGLLFACDLVSTINLVIELSPDRDKTVYQATYNTLLVPARVAYPLLAGWLAEGPGLPVLFKVALLMQALGVAMVLMLVKDPKGSAGRRGEEV